MRVRGERWSRKVKKEPSRERFMAAMRHGATVEEEGRDREREREKPRMPGKSQRWRTNVRDTEGEAERIKG